MMSDHLKFLLVKEAIERYLEGAETIGQARDMRDAVNDLADTLCERSMDKLLDAKYGGR